MIRVNLLKSVTDRHDSPVSAVERKVASPGLRLLVMALVVGALTMAVIGWDIISAEMAKAATQAELENQKQIAAQLEVIIKEQTDLELKIKNIDTRIDAIKKLQENQKGPSAVLDALSQRIAMVPGLYLENVDQKGDQLTITGNSPSERLVADFAKSLEFSNELFSNLSIDLTRKDVTTQQVSIAGADGPNGNGGSLPKGVETVNFTIKCSYTPSKAPDVEGTQLASGQNPQAANAPKPGNPQVAKN